MSKILLIICFTSWGFLFAQANASAVMPRGKHNIVKHQKNIAIPVVLENTELLKLARFFGALHHLDNICRKNKADLWQFNMITIIVVNNFDLEQNLMDAQAVKPPKKTITPMMIIEEFNLGFDYFSKAHLYCSSLAAKIAGDIFEQSAKILNHSSGKNAENSAGFEMDFDIVLSKNRF